jgi:hypothetical protein
VKGKNHVSYYRRRAEHRIPASRSQLVLEEGFGGGPERILVQEETG